jgi:hypothetical protein
MITTRAHPARSERSARRQRALLMGKLVFGIAVITIDCTIRDLSETGARVRLPHDLPTPDTMWLIVISTGVAYQSEVRWRQGQDLGLSFTAEHDLKTPAPLSGDYLRRLWLDCSPRYSQR